MLLSAASGRGQNRLPGHTGTSDTSSQLCGQEHPPSITLRTELIGLDPRASHCTEKKHVPGVPHRKEGATENVFPNYSGPALGAGPCQTGGSLVSWGLEIRLRGTHLFYFFKDLFMGLERWLIG